MHTYKLTVVTLVYYTFYSAVLLFAFAKIMGRTTLVCTRPLYVVQWAWPVSQTTYLQASTHTQLTDHCLWKMLQGKGYYIARHPSTQEVRVQHLRNTLKDRKQVGCVHFSHQTSLQMDKHSYIPPWYLAPPPQRLASESGQNIQKIVLHGHPLMNMGVAIVMAMRHSNNKIVCTFYVPKRCNS